MRGGQGPSVKKVKFTVAVKGRNWSSARHLNETLEEFSAAVERNARLLKYIKEDDTIQSLQLACFDGSEPEDLDVDATLGDVIICKGDKQLIAIVKSSEPSQSATISPGGFYSINHHHPTPSPPQPTGGFQSFPAALLSLLPMLAKQSDYNLQGATTNIALFAQYLASQLLAFVPTERAVHPRPTDGTHTSQCRGNKEAPPPPKDHANNPDSNGQAAPPNSGTTTQQTKKEKSSSSTSTSQCRGNKEAPPPPKDHANNPASNGQAAQPNSGTTTQETEKKKSSLSKSELGYLVNRRRKRGVKARYLKMSDLSPYFHLILTDAATELDICQTTLKKACRGLGLNRWPGRKIRGLEGHIHQAQQTIPVGQGAGLKKLATVSKLQQERDQLVHGTPARISQAMHSKSTNGYKRLYSRGWHSNDLQTRNHENRTSRLAPPSRRKAKNQASKVAAAGPKLVRCKEEAVENPQNPVCKERFRSISRDTVMKDYDTEGLLRELARMQPVNNNVEGGAAPAAPVPVDNAAVVNCPEKATNHKRKEIEEEEVPFQERGPKRSKGECRIPARQGLRSSTSAM